MPESRETFQFDVPGTIATSSVDRWVAPHPGEITGVTLSVGTAPTDADLIINLAKNGTNIYTTSANRPKIVAGATKTAARAPAPDTAAFTTNDEIKLVVSQVGSTVAGADLNVSVEYVNV